MQFDSGMDVAMGVIRNEGWPKMEIPKSVWVGVWEAVRSMKFGRCGSLGEDGGSALAVQHRDPQVYD